MNTLESLLSNVKNLPSLPAVALKIIELVKKENSSLSEMTSIISYDPALSAQILKLANSSFYGLPYKVESTDRAVNVLGLEALKNIALSFSIVKGFKRNSIDLFDHELFWKRSITTAVCTEMIVSRLKINREDTFVTPLLMDIGILIMYLSDPDTYLKVIDEKRSSNLTMYEAEREIFGFDHQDVGGEILKTWGLPDSICNTISCHHRKDECGPDAVEMVNILHIADLASSVYHGSYSTAKLGTLKELLKEKLEMSDSDVSDFVDSVAEKTIEILSSFQIEAGEMKPYSQILQEANEELGKLNISYEQLVMELRQQKSKVETLATELKGANEKLRELAFKDGLTDLFNHRYFQDLIEKEVQRASRYSRILTFIMIDIDYFKKINDTYGHPSGDAVLKELAKLLNDSVRKPDSVARYGGEEFAILLPETNLVGALTFSERLRKNVEGMEVTIGDTVLKVTISLGLASYDPGNGIRAKSEIIESADKALYNAKMSGRNKISVATM